MKIVSIASVYFCCVCNAKAVYQCVVCEQYFCTPDGCPRQRRVEQHYCVRLAESPQEEREKC